MYICGKLVENYFLLTRRKHRISLLLATYGLLCGIRNISLKYEETRASIISVRIGLQSNGVHLHVRTVSNLIILISHDDCTNKMVDNTVYATLWRKCQIQKEHSQLVNLFYQIQLTYYLVMTDADQSMKYQLYNGVIVSI